MKFRVEKVSDYLFQEEINIETIEDLKNLFERFEEALIVEFDPPSEISEFPLITVYDDYIE